MAQPACISPMALPRCSAGHVSATSTEPADHSPPSPMPTSARHSTSCGDAGRGGRERGEDRVGEDGPDQRPRAAEAVRQNAEQRAAEAPR